jgi:hypothetical protein
MKFLRIVTLIALLLSACSCAPLPSFFPLWDEQHAAFEAQLLGEWGGKDSSDNSVLKFTESEGKTYQVALTKKGKSSGTIVGRTIVGRKIDSFFFTAKLVRLGKRLFLDFMDDEDSINNRLGGGGALAMIRMHFFVRFDLDGDILKLAYLDNEKFEKKVLKNEIDLPIIKQGSTILLTAETSRIQQVLSQFAEDKDLWINFGPMYRRPVPESR